MEPFIKLSFRKDEYRVLILADLQEHAPVAPRVLERVGAMLDECAPDLVILLGDMVYGFLTHRRRSVTAVISDLVRPMEERGIPYLAISGNHDTDSLTPWRTQAAFYASLPGCLTPAPEARACADCYGALLYGRDGAPVCRFLLLDSGKTLIDRYGPDYAPATEGQLRWTKQVLAENALPAFVFQHIPVPEIYRLLRQVPRQKGAVRGRGKYRGRYFLPDPRVWEGGTLGESPCPPWFGNRQFADWADSGLVRAAFFGHDHVNDFFGTLDGVRLVHSSCAGLRCYGRNELRGARLLRIREDAGFDSRMIYYRELTGEEGRG